MGKKLSIKIFLSKRKEFFLHDKPQRKQKSKKEKSKSVFIVNI